MTYRQTLETLPDPELPIVVTAGPWEGKVGRIEIVAALGTVPEYAKVMK